MKVIPKALKDLYEKLGGEEAIQNDAETVDVLNKISALFGGDDDAILNPDAIDNITSVIDLGGDYSIAKVKFNYSGPQLFQIAMPVRDESYIESVITQGDISETIDCVLFKGQTNIYIVMGAVDFSSATGDCQIIKGDTAVITGNCEITLKDWN